MPTSLSQKQQQFLHTAFRQIPSLRRAHPNPLAGIHPATAASLGIAEGD